MSFSARVPGMRRGRLVYNLLVLGVYVAFLPILVALLLVVLPILLMIGTGLNVRGMADRLSALPGVSPDGGVKSAGAGLCYGLAVVMIIGLIPGGSTPNDGGATAGTVTPTPDGAAALGTPTSTPTPMPTATSPATLTPGATSSTPSTPTGSPTATGARTQSPVETPTQTSTPIATATATSTSADGTLIATVTRVVDGDTLEVRLENGSTDTLRLIGVDTPEVHVENAPEEFEGVPDTRAGADCLRRYGERASAYVTDRLDGERITVRFDDRSDRRGFYGRLLVYVLHDGANVNYQLVANGYARVYDSSFSQSSRFYDAESEAQNQQRRVWACRNIETSTPTPDGGDDESGSLIVAEIHADAAGNDHENENGEYVVFENTGSSTLDLSGWVVEDEVDHTYIFPSGFGLEPGARVTLYTGSGSNTDSELYWGSDSAIWNNDGDTVIVRDDSGDVVVEESY